MNQKIKKIYLKTWAIHNYYKYDVFEIDAGGLHWIEAVPHNQGVVRSADTEKKLRTILENDAYQMNIFQQKVK